MPCDLAKKGGREMTENKKSTIAKTWYGGGGALVSDVPFNNEAPLPSKHEKYYGKPYFIAESMSESTAKKISDALGMDYQGKL